MVKSCDVMYFFKSFSKRGQCLTPAQTNTTKTGTWQTPHAMTLMANSVVQLSPRRVSCCLAGCRWWVLHPGPLGFLQKLTSELFDDECPGRFVTSCCTRSLSKTIKIRLACREVMKRVFTSSSESTDASHQSFIIPWQRLHTLSYNILEEHCSQFTGSAHTRSETWEISLCVWTVSAGLVSRSQCWKKAKTNQICCRGALKELP